MIPKPLNDIAFDDIEALCVSDIPEGATLEYKRQLPNNEKLVETFCAMANTSTGDIIIGAEQNNGYLAALPGIDRNDVDELKQKVSQLNQTGLQPPGAPIQCRDIPVANGRFVVVIRVEYSWIGPHQVVNKKRFLVRDSVRNRDMTVDELRRAFGQGISASNIMRSFQAERAEQYRSLSVPISMRGGPKLLLHVFPLAGILNQYRVPLDLVHELLPTLNSSKFAVSHLHYNLDGVVGTQFSSDIEQQSYVQVFRNGVVEIVKALHSEWMDVPNKGKIAFLRPLEYTLIPILEKLQELVTGIGLPSPSFIFTSVVDVKNCGLLNRRGSIVRDPQIEWHQNMLLVDVQMPADSKALISEMRPVFDMFWQGFGYRGSELFDESGGYLHREW